MEITNKECITLKEANEIADAAINEACKQGYSITAVVVDTHGSLITLKRMDLCLIGPLEVAIKKARTAALFGSNSKDFGKMARPDGDIYSIEHTNGGLISFGGGILITHNNQPIGGLGVSGSTVGGDERIAQMAIKRIESDKE